jgi:uncharacterized membrane protein YadS
VLNRLSEIGATIHNVAKAVGAGYSISDDAGVIATFVKMLRVALLPVVMVVAMSSLRVSGYCDLGVGCQNKFGRIS